MRGAAILFCLSALTACNSNAPSPGASPTAEAPSSFFPTAAEIRRAEENQLEQKAEKTLSGFDGIERARVHISLPDNRLNARQQHPARATAVIWKKKNGTIRNDRVRAVVASVSLELDAQNVEVILNRPDATSGKGSGARADSPYRLILVVVLLICLTGAMGMMAVGVRRRMANRRQTGNVK